MTQHVNCKENAENMFVRLYGWKLYICMYVIRLFICLRCLLVHIYLGCGGWFVAIIDQGIISIQNTRVVTQLGTAR
jgi:hypothetical protein